MYKFNAFNQTAYEKKKESVKAEPIPGFGSYSPAPYEASKANTYTRTEPVRYQQSDSYYKQWMDSHNESYGRSGLDRVFDALQVGQYTVAGAFKGYFDVKGSPLNPLTIGKRVAGATVGALKGIRAANPLGEGYDEGEASFTDVFSSMGWNPKSKTGKIARGVVGFAGDVLLDPLTWVSGGTTAFLKGTGTGAKVGVKASKEIIEKFGLEVAQDIAEKAALSAGKGLSREAAQKILFDLGESITTKNVDDFIARVNKFAGVNKNLGKDMYIGFGKNKKVLIDEDVLRMLGDKTVAPYVNALPNMIRNTGILKGLDTKDALKQLAKYDINRTANTLLANDIRNRHSVALAKDIVSAKKKMANIGSKFTKEQQLRIVDIADDTEKWIQKTTTTGLVDTDFGRKLIKKYSDELDEIDVLIDNYNKLISQKRSLADSENKLMSVVSKLDAADSTAELNKIKEFKATLVDSRVKIKQSLFDMANESPDQIVKKKIIDYRTNYKIGDKYVDAPYGNRKAGDFFRSGDGIDYNIKGYTEKPMSTFNKGYGTSSESVNKFLNTKTYSVIEDTDLPKLREESETLTTLIDNLDPKNKDIRKLSKDLADVNKEIIAKEAKATIRTNIDNKILRDRLEDLINKTPMLANDFDMMPLKTNISDDQLFKALDLYANKPADEFFEYTKELRAGYDEAKAIAELELDDALSAINPKTMTQAQVAKARKDAYKAKFRRVDELMLKEDERLEIYIKNIEKSDAVIRKNKEKAAKGLDYGLLNERKYDLEVRLQNGTISDEELLELRELGNEVGFRNKKLNDAGITTGAQVDAAKKFGGMSDSEIDNIIRTDYKGKGTKAQKYEEFDPWEDIDEVSLKAGETELFADALTQGQDMIRVYGDARTPDWMRRDNILDEDDIDMLLNTDDEIDDLIDEFMLGKGKSVGVASVDDMEKANLFDQMTSNTLFDELSDEEFSRIYDVSEALESRKFNRAKKIAEKLDETNADAAVKYKAKQFKGKIDDLFKQSFDENVSGITDETVVAARQRKYAEGIVEAQEAKAKAYNTTREQIDNLEKYLKLDFESTVKELNALDKKQVKGYKRSMMKKYFPNRKLKDLTQAEIDTLEGFVDVAIEEGIIPKIDRVSFYDELLERTDIEINNMDEISEAIEMNAQQTKEGYWIQNQKLKEKIDIIDSEIAELENTRDYSRLIEKQKELRQAFNENKMDDYARNNLGIAYNQFVETRQIPGFELAEGLLEASDGELIPVIKEIRKILDDMAVVEESNKLASYFPHVVKEKHKNLFNNYVTLTENALVGSDGRPFLANKAARKFEGSIDDFHKAWDDSVYRQGKVPTFKDFFGEDMLDKAGNPIAIPRDLFEDDLVKALTERAIRHENYVFDSKNSKKILDLVSEEYIPNKRVPTGTEIVVIPRADLIKEARIIMEVNGMKGQVTTDFIEEHFRSKYLSDIFIRPDDLYAEVRGGIDQIYSATDEYGKKIYNTRIMKQEVSEHFNQLSQYQKAEGVQKVLDAYDNVLSLWKLNVTVVSPAFHFRNIAGNVFNNYLDIGTKAFSFKERKKIASIMTGTYDGLIGGFDAEEIMEIAKQFEVVDSGQFGFEIRKLMQDSKKVAKRWSKADPTNPIDFIPYKFGTKVGSYIENLDKMLNFVHHIEQGMNPQAAAEMTHKFLFDYKSATVFEKEVLRRAIPFWTWSKKNIPLQMEMLLEHPERYRMFAKGLQTIDKSNTGDDRITFDRKRDTGDFAEDWITTPSGNEDVMIFNPNLPFQDLSINVRSLIGRLSPFLKVPVEVATDYDSYYNTEIDSNLKHILKQIGPLSNLGKLAKKQGKDRRLELLAQLGGLRFLNYDQEKYNYRKIINELDRKDN